MKLQNTITEDVCTIHSLSPLSVLYAICCSCTFLGLLCALSQHATKTTAQLAAEQQFQCQE